MSEKEPSQEPLTSTEEILENKEKSLTENLMANEISQNFFSSQSSEKLQEVDFPPTQVTESDGVRFVENSQDEETESTEFGRFILNNDSTSHKICKPDHECQISHRIRIRSWLMSLESKKREILKLRKTIRQTLQSDLENLLFPPKTSFESPIPSKTGKSSPKPKSRKKK